MYVEEFRASTFAGWVVGVWASCGYGRACFAVAGLKIERLYPASEENIVWSGEPGGMSSLVATSFMKGSRGELKVSPGRRQLTKQLGD